MKKFYKNLVSTLLMGRILCTTLSRYWTPYQISGLQRDSSRTLSQPFIYSDKNTSPILPKPLNRQQIKHLFDLLMKSTDNLPASNNLINKDAL